MLGAAAITPRALIAPAAEIDDIELSCVAARDRSRAEQFAAQHGIATVHDSYADVVTDPEIDAVYNPLQIQAGTASGRCARSRPASTCSARSRWR